MALWLPAASITAALAVLVGGGVWYRGGGLGAASATVTGVCALWVGCRIQATRKYWLECKAATLVRRL